MSQISKTDQKLLVKKIDKKTINIQIFDNDMLASIVGEFNKNLIEIEKLTNSKIFFQRQFTYN